MNTLEYKRADLHIHSNLSDGVMDPDQIVELARRCRLSAVAITDHDKVEGSWRAKEYLINKGYKDIEVVSGVEITTSNGHMLAYGLRDDVPKGLSPVETVVTVLEKGGLPYIAHPFMKIHKTDAIYEIDGASPRFGIAGKVGLETVNGSLAEWINGANVLTKMVYNQTRGRWRGIVGGSDSHLYTIGTGATYYTGDLMDDLRNGRTIAGWVFARERAQLRAKAAEMFGYCVLLREDQFRQRWQNFSGIRKEVRKVG